MSLQPHNPDDLLLSSKPATRKGHAPAPSEWKAVYLDSSAAIVLIGRGHGANRVRRYLQESVTAFTMTQMCFSVAVVTLKVRRHRRTREGTARAYGEKCAALMACVRNGWIETVDMPLVECGAASVAETFAAKHELDLVESMELMTIRGAQSRGRHQRSSLVITASRAVARAARAEKIRTWDCLRETSPVS